MTTQAIPAVFTAIKNVLADLGKQGISKDNTNSIQGWKFRGIDQVYSALNPLLAQHNLLMLPRVISRSAREVTNSKGTTLIYTTLEIEYIFVSTEDGSKHSIIVCGEAMDSGDKSVNKAMSAAYKYAAIQAFCIPVEGDDDPDRSVHEITGSSHSLTDAKHLNADDGGLREAVQQAAQDAGFPGDSFWKSGASKSGSYMEMLRKLQAGIIKGPHANV